MATRTPARELTETELHAWRAVLRAHAVATRQLDAELVAECGLPLVSYEVLLVLHHQPERRLRMTDLADRVLLSRSGLTRLVDRLERDGLVRREQCPSDARGTFAAVTPEGSARLRAAAPVHLRGIRQHVTGKFDATELATLAALLGRVAGDGSETPNTGDSC